MRKISILLWLLLGCSIAAFAQDKFTISGYMKDASTGEELIGSTVYIEQLAAGTSTNVYGFYSLIIQ
jgi:hypothetical protein